MLDQICLGRPTPELLDFRFPKVHNLIYETLIELAYETD